MACLGGCDELVTISHGRNNIQQLCAFLSVLAPIHGEIPYASAIFPKIRVKRILMIIGLNLTIIN